MSKLQNPSEIVLEASIRRFPSGKQELHLLCAAGMHKGVPEYFNQENIKLCIYWQINGQAKLPAVELRKQCYDPILEFSSAILKAKRNHWTPVMKRVFKLPESST